MVPRKFEENVRERKRRRTIEGKIIEGKLKIDLKSINYF